MGLEFGKRKMSQVNAVIKMAFPNSVRAASSTLVYCKRA